MGRGGGQWLPSGAALLLGDLGLKRILWSIGRSPGEQDVMGGGGGVCTDDLFRKMETRTYAGTELARCLGLAGCLCRVSGHTGRGQKQEHESWVC